MVNGKRRAAVNGFLKGRWVQGWMGDGWMGSINGAVNGFLKRMLWKGDGCTGDGSRGARVMRGIIHWS
jgi:hypothetical protein